MLERILKPYENARLALYPDDSFSCDVGAVTLAYLADRNHLKREIVQGTYLHRDLASYCRAVGEDFETALKELQPGQSESAPVEEAHTWLLIHPDGENSILIDPNGELRGEPRVQSLNGTGARYREFEAGHEMIELDRNDDPEELAAEGWDRRLNEALEFLNH